MRVVLEMLSGTERGRKIRLSANQTLTVGRTEWADFVVADDRHMSSKHFSVEVSGDGCRLTDLQSANGTLVNGAPAVVTLLKNGDQVMAGESQFLVRIEMTGDQLDSSLNSGFHFPVAKPVPQPRQQPASSSLPTPDIGVRQTANGMYHAQCQVSQLPPAELLARLVRLAPLHLIVDYGRLGLPRPEGRISPLFDWLEPAAQAASPVLVSPADQTVVRPLLESGWGKDGLVLLFADLPPADLLKQLRKAIRAPRGGVVGYAWPSVLGPMLANSLRSRLELLLGGVELVMLEDADDPQHWQVYSLGNLAVHFERVGLRTTDVNQTLAN